MSILLINRWIIYDCEINRESNETCIPAHMLRLVSVLSQGEDKIFNKISVEPDWIQPNELTCNKIIVNKPDCCINLMILELPIEGGLVLGFQGQG